MTSRYGQYCPVSLATEIMGERWTILIILVLCDGVTRFNDIQRALPLEFTDLPSDRRFYWIVVHDRSADVCLKHPGFEPDVCVVSDIQRFVDAWRGFRSLSKELVSRRIKVSGPKERIRGFPDWLLLSSVSNVRRERPGRERTLQTRHADSNQCLI